MSFEPGGATSPSRLESLGTQLLAARTGVDEPTRAPWRLKPARTGVHEPTRTLDSSLLAVLGAFLVARADSSRLESRSGLGSSRLVNNTIIMCKKGLGARIYGGSTVLEVQMALVATKRLKATTRWQGRVTELTSRCELLADEGVNINKLQWIVALDTEIIASRYHKSD